MDSASIPSSSGSSSAVSSVLVTADDPSRSGLTGGAAKVFGLHRH